MLSTPICLKLIRFAMLKGSHLVLKTFILKLKDFLSGKRISNILYENGQAHSTFINKVLSNSPL